MREAPRFDSADSFGSLLLLLAVLRGPDGCPWDREQAPADHLRHLAEEAAEAAAALAGEGDPLEEAADVFLNATLLLEAVAREAGRHPDDLLADLHQKLVRRHPHVFGPESAADAAAAVAAWQRAKESEG